MSNYQRVWENVGNIWRTVGNICIENVGKMKENQATKMGTFRKDNL